MSDFSATIVSTQQLQRLSEAIERKWGVFGNHGAVSTSSGLTVAVAAVPANNYVINAAIQSNAFVAATVTHEAANDTLPRIDTVKINTSGAVAIEKGTPASDPVPPDLASTELELSQNLIAAGVTEVASGDITDRRQQLSELVIRKAATESITTDDTLSDDAEFFCDLEASSTYEVTFLLLVNAHATPDLKLNVTLPASGGANGVVIGPTAVLSFVESADHVVAGAAADEGLLVKLSVVIAATAGTFALQWAQNTSDGNATAVLLDSVMTVKKVA